MPLSKKINQENFMLVNGLFNFKKIEYTFHTILLYSIKSLTGVPLNITIRLIQVYIIPLHITTLD
jgi:hypothetical protein